jgi:hypothetical protein
MVSYAISPANINQQAFLQSRPDIVNAGLDFSTWYDRFGKNENLQQFEGFMSGGAVKPADIEPLHQFEREGLVRQATQPISPYIEQAAQYLQGQMGNMPTINPQATGFLDSASQYISRGAAPITRADVEDISNPNAQALQARLNERGEMARAALLGKQGQRGSASFGDTSTGQQLGDLRSELLRGASDIDFATYESALAQLQKMRDRDMMGGAYSGNLAGTAQNITDAGSTNAARMASTLGGLGGTLYDAARTQTSDMIGAGTAIRGFNQSMLDRMTNNLLAEQGFDAEQLKQIQDLLGFYKSGERVATGGGANTLQTIGGTAGMLGELLKPSASTLPWQKAGFTNPATGLSY